MSTLQVTTTKSPTCRACHQRKVRCDGLNPCGSCSRARKPLVCEYLEPSARATTELPKGAACDQCRKRKRKCDGNRPTCLACKNASDACQYREKRPLREPRNEQRAIQSHGAATVEASLPPSSVVVSAPVESNSTDTHGALHHLESITTTTAVSHAAETLLTTPQVSTVEMDLPTELSSIRNLFLDHCWYYGWNIGAEKRAAIARGDISGSVIHPIFIPVSQLVGYMLVSQGDYAEYAYLRGHLIEREAEQRARALALLDTYADEDVDPLTRVQVYKLLAQYHAHRRNFRGYQEFLGNASNVALKHHAALGLDDSTSAVSVQQKELEEGRSALAHLVYLEISAKIVMKFPPRLPPVMLAKFRRLAMENICEFELNFVRAKSILLLAEAQQLVEEYKSSEPGSMVGSEWGERWIKATNCIQSHLSSLDTALAKYPPLTHRVPHLMLRSCTVVVLAALAELYALFAPFHGWARQKHAGIIESIAGISRTFATGDHQYFDCTLETCWEIASREIPEPTEPIPQWQVCFANVVLLGGHEPSQLPDPEPSLLLH